MNEFDQDALLTGAFSEFSSAAAPTVRPLGAQAVRGEVAHRRKVRAVALSVVAALVVALPVAGYAAFGRESQGPPTPGTSVVPTPSVSESPSPSPSTPASPAPDGRITIAQLTAGKVDLPKWGKAGTTMDGSCNDGRTKLVKAVEHNPMLTSYVQEVAYANLDADAALETAALIMCAPGEAELRQVVAFDRDATGKIATVGTVFSGNAWSVTANATGGIDVDVSDFQACCDTPKIMELHQTRTFGWDGTKIAQLAGPTTFTSHSKPIDMKVTVTKTVWGEIKDHRRTATITAKVTNNGPSASNSFMLFSNSGGGNLVEGFNTVHPGLAAGESVNVILKIEFDVRYDQVFVVSLWEQGVVGIRDKNPADNQARIDLKVS
ncbi:MAG: hypothetical protein HOU81_14135 [Hamadaea sp.]|uniref:hypothetical protein n=1 Tax=Hamadaea sp. TaxID=2024425 RepID=UPI00184F3074|nr:hypothetical protein [Hamadaea sp.]NUR71955.1 hypothetical protein [Hamadaea sp.]NUT17810.1 hypothetical protein [Hamadaea sp.]